MSDVQKWHNDTLGNRTVAALKKNGFDAVYFSTSDEAVNYMSDMIEKGQTIGFGGSMTVKDLGIHIIAAEKNAVILDHNDPTLDNDKRLEVLRAQLTCDLFVSSANAISLEGEILNVDGVGNRVAALTFGPKKAVIIAGCNKIVPDMDSALVRLEILAAPMNVHRLSRNTPCAKTGICEDCSSPERICRVYSIMKRKPTRSSITVVLIGEELGY
jgi:L-lactate utilization protein LutB